MASYVGAIDQGTTSTRFIVFNHSGQIVATAQKEHQQIYPQPGWVEHDAEEIWERTQEVITTAMQQVGETRIRVVREPEWIVHQTWQSVESIPSSLTPLLLPAL